VAIYTSAKALSRWPINDESTLTGQRTYRPIKKSAHDLTGNRVGFVTQGIIRNLRTNILGIARRFRLIYQIITGVRSAVRIRSGLTICFLNTQNKRKSFFLFLIYNRGYI
jgi:hypothetical protein